MIYMLYCVYCVVRYHIDCVVCDLYFVLHYVLHVLLCIMYLHCVCGSPYYALCIVSCVYVLHVVIVCCVCCVVCFALCVVCYLLRMPMLCVGYYVLCLV